MYKNTVIINIAIIICITFGLGCENKTKEIAKPKIVSKKISEESNKLPKTKKSLSSITNISGETKETDQDQSIKTDNVLDKTMIKNANYEKVKNLAANEEALNSRQKALLPSDSIENNSSLMDKDLLFDEKFEEDKREAAELLASIHSKVNQTDQNKNDGLDRLGNPFLPLFSDSPVAQKEKTKRKSKPEKERTPLEKVDLSQLKLVATLRAESGNKALVEDSTGKGYVINKGTYIGINSGSVIEITNQSVVVEEEIETITGDVKIKRREIKLQKAPGE